jgi:hypothetical protein
MVFYTRRRAAPTPVEIITFYNTVSENVLVI